MHAPLPALAAGPARAYLEAMLPEGDVSDAWHDLQEDVAYWGDRDLAAVLHLAHEVVRQRLRVTDEAATLALLDDAGVDDPAVIARCLGLEVDAAQDLLQRARAALHGDKPAGDPAAEDPPAGASAPPPTPAPATAMESIAPGPGSGTSAAPTRAVDADARFAEPRPTTRITFDDTSAPAGSHVGPGDEKTGRPGPRTRVLLVWAAVIWAVIVIAWILGAFG